MNVLQYTRNERNPCLRQNRPDRSYRDTLLNLPMTCTLLNMIFSKAENKILIMIRGNNKDNREYKLFFYLLLWKNMNVCLIEMGKLIFITMWDFLLGLISDLYVNTVMVCWYVER